MPSVGFNSILFEFDSIVDKELSIIKLLSEQYSEIKGLNLTKMRETGIDRLKIDRVINPSGTLKIYFEDKDIDVNDWMAQFIEKREKDILEYAVQTDMTKLLKGYKDVGNGVIRTAVRCNNTIESSYIKKNFNTSVIIEDRKNINTSDYGRFIVSNYKQALEYEFEEPKSILVLNFRENFTLEDNTLLNPELVISLGDINDIEVIPAFDNMIMSEKSKG